MDTLPAHACLLAPDCVSNLGRTGLPEVSQNIFQAALA